MDGEISQGRKDALRQIFQDRASLDEVEDAFAEFSTNTMRFATYDVIRDREGLRCPILGGKLMGQHALLYSN